MVDFEPLGALLGPGAPDPDLVRSVLKLNVQDNTKSIQIPYFLLDVQNELKFLKFVCFNRTSIRHTKSIQIPGVVLSDVQKVLKVPMFLTLTFPWPRRSHCNYCHLLLCPRHDLSIGATLFNKKYITASDT